MAEISAFSYLAAVSTLHVARMPAEDYGEAVTAIERFVAADGPIMLGVAACLGRSTALVANKMGSDDLGEATTGLLEAWGVRCESSPAVNVSPSSTVIASATGTRTFFPHLPGVLEHLRRTAIDSLLEAEWAYVDCYEVLETVTERPVRERLRWGGPIILNLGGSPRPAWLTPEELGGRVTVVQTSVSDGDKTEALKCHDRLVQAGIADVVLVSAGSAGAVASDSTGNWIVRVPEIIPCRVQGAGSAMSAGVIHRFLSDSGTADAVRFGCAVGTAWCTESSAMPSLAAVESLLERTSVAPF